MHTKWFLFESEEERVEELEVLEVIVDHIVEFQTLETRRRQHWPLWRMPTSNYGADLVPRVVSLSDCEIQTKSPPRRLWRRPRSRHHIICPGYSWISLCSLFCASLHLYTLHLVLTSSVVFIAAHLPHCRATP